MKNLGTIDAAIRTLLGVVLLGLAATALGHPLLAAGAVTTGFILTATGMIRFCPLYAALGIDTYHPDKKRQGA